MPSMSHTAERAVGPMGAPAVSVSRTPVHALRAFTCDTSATRCASMRMAVGYRSPGGWTLDALAALWGVARGRAAEWLTGRRALPTRAVAALPVAERAAYFAALDSRVAA